MTEATKQSGWPEALAARLAKLADPDDPDREALAHLRRALGGPPDHTLSRVGWLFRGVPDDRADNSLDAAILAAGLFAWTRGDCRHTAGVNFGQAFGAGLSKEDHERREKRFTALLDTDREELPYQLRQAVTLVRGANLDWALLVRHVAAWEHADRWVQKLWARGYWSVAPTETEDDTETDPATT